MDDNKKRKLLEKRELLNQKLNLLKEKNRQDDLKHRLRYQIEYLERNDFSYSINYNDEYLYWMQRNYPIRKKDGYYGIHDFQIDIQDEDENCTSIYFEKHDDIQFVFERELLKLSNTEQEIVKCVNGGDPELVISIKALLSDVDVFLNSAEVWFILKDKSLVIEYISDRKSIRFVK